MDTARISEFLKLTAEETINPRFRQLAEGDVEAKSHPNDLVTIADREAEDHLAAQLRDAFPSAVIVGEETVFLGTTSIEDLAHAEHAFVIDPIDGTRNFVHGNPDHGVMLAELRKGETTRGWIWQPQNERLYTVEKGSGEVLLNGQPVKPGPAHNPPLGATGSKGLGSDLGGRIQRTIRSSGAACVDYPNIVAGVIDFMYFSRSYAWDHLAGALMLAETGGVTRLVDGEEYSVRTTGRGLIPARTPEIWDLVGPRWAY